MLRSPKRRPTRQRSGYTVSGEKSGNEAKIVHSCAYQVLSPSLVLSFENTDAEIVPQFEDGIGMAAIGGYIKCDTPFEFSYKITVLDPLNEAVIGEKEKIVEPPQNRWYKFGLHVELDDASLYEAVSLKGVIKLRALQTELLNSVRFLGVNLDTVSEYDRQSVTENFGDQARQKFGQKTYLYYPEIYYWDHEQPFTLDPVAIEGEVASIAKGEQVVLKACNRCARFLPIDLFDERNALGFSNHCVRRAPCTHRAFSHFVIENWDDLEEIDSNLQERIRAEDEDYLLHAYYGFQLECRPCKKFKVNAPLNPLRNAAQRREDSLRRRAFERLVRHLLGIDWIFYKFRREKRPDEFDMHIWKKFGRKCFACGRPLPRVTDMELDHTLPLVYLWPLDETATCLCSTCNSQKHDKFPYEFERYRAPGKLERLGELTGIDKGLLLDQKKHVNPKAIKRLREEIKWFFDDFLAEHDYQKVRHEKKAADLIVASLQRVLDECETGLSLIQEYKNRTGRLPETVTIGSS